MATYNYNNTITQVDNATINFELLSVVPPTTVVTSVTYSRFTNQITGVIANMAASFPSNPLPNDYNLTSTAAGMGSVFGDSVYRYESNYASGADDEYESDDYFLVCTAIDAAILAYPVTTDEEIAQKAYIVSVRALVTTLFDSADYTNCNNRIKQLTDILFNLTDASLTFVATLPSPDQITLTGSNSFLTTYIGGWYNVLTNTLTEVEYPYTWNFTTPSQSKNVTQSSNYPDGVYTNYSSALVSVVTGFANNSKLYAGTSYLPVTTTVDAQVTLYGANYDPSNAAEAIAYADMQSLQTQIDAAFADEDYTLTNELIAQLQALLANGVSITVLAKLNSNSEMLVYFETLPTGTYTTPTGTITNTLSGISFTFDGFPADNEDLTTILNSQTLGFGTDFPDGTYQVVVNFYLDGLLFTSSCYLVVTTDWQCCIDKAVGKKCGNLNVALMQSNLTNAVRIVALYSDVDTANALIKEGNRLCSGCGCS